MTDHVIEQPEAHPDAELVDGLEPDQMSVAASRPLPRMELGHAANAAFWAVRIFVLAMAALVAYTFVVSVLHPS